MAETSVVERFMRYVRVASASDPERADVVPSTAGQHDMARLLARELAELGCDDVAVDAHAYVTAAVPASPGSEGAQPLGLIAHIDTSPDAPGEGVSPHVVRYEGGDLVAGIVDGVPVATSLTQLGDLADLVGHDIICSDGTTLLGADDKAGVAEIMALVERLMAHPELPRPPLRIAFVPDEEIGHGAALLDLERFGAAFAYTVDGGPLGEFSYECFNAAQVTVRILGTMAHPGDAKGVMVNAIALAAEFDALVPAAERPEHTEDREGFYHPISVAGSASEATLSYLVRDFDAASFSARIATLERIAAFLCERHGEGVVAVEVEEQYRNMAEYLADKDFLITRAIEANREAGVEPTVLAVRGGTDGAQLTFRGLPCPNIATGGYNYHSVREFVPVESLVRTVEVLERLVAMFAGEGAGA